jgi:rhodanese-related sulfurtransferase
MKFILESYNWVLLLAALVSGGLLLWPLIRQGAGGAGSVSPNEAVRLINREKGVLIDVGEPAEFAAGHAAGARSVPLASLAAPESAKGLPSNKTLPLLLMCPSGSRASRAAAQLRKAGYAKAVAVAGGNSAWRAANLPMEKQSS